MQNLIRGVKALGNKLGVVTCSFALLLPVINQFAFTINDIDSVRFKL